MQGKIADSINIEDALHGLGSDYSLEKKREREREPTVLLGKKNNVERKETFGSRWERRTQGGRV